jgi:hypothetical protein
MVRYVDSRLRGNDGIGSIVPLLGEKGKHYSSCQPEPSSTCCSGEQKLKRISDWLILLDDFGGGQLAALTG